MVIFARGGTMSDKSVDLTGKFCPYPIVRIVFEVDQLAPGQSVTFVVDDPLALKSVPEELDEYDDITFETTKSDEGWQIKVRRRA